MNETSSSEDPGDALESVLLTTARPVDAAAVGRAVASLLRLEPTDSVRHARYCGGIALDGVPGEVAESAVLALSEAGVGARRLLAEAVPPLPRPRRATRATAGASALVVGSALAREEAIPWGDIALVLAFALEGAPARRRGARPLQRDPEALLAGEETRLGPSTRRIIASLVRARRDERREPALLLDIVVLDGRVLRLRRDELELVRAPGLEGAAPHSVEAFVALARDIGARAGGAIRPSENEALLEGGLIEPALFFYEDELVRYERWLLAPPISR